MNDEIPPLPIVIESLPNDPTEMDYAEACKWLDEETRKIRESQIYVPPIQVGFIRFHSGEPSVEEVDVPLVVEKKEGAALGQESPTYGPSPLAGLYSIWRNMKGAKRE